VKILGIVLFSTLLYVTKLEVELEYDRPKESLGDIGYINISVNYKMNHSRSALLYIDSIFHTEKRKTKRERKGRLSLLVV